MKYIFDSVSNYKNCLVTKKMIGQKLLSDGLKKLYNINYNELIFYKNEFGKPFIKDSNIYYNISHSKDIIVCVFDNKPIGIDIEKIRNINLNTINYFATAKEKKYILEDSKKSIKRLIEIYILKESYFKMLGTNLDKIQEVEFEIINNKVNCSDLNVTCKLIHKIKGYIIAICKKNN